MTNELPHDDRSTDAPVTDDAPTQTIVSPVGHEPVIDAPRVLRDRIVTMQDTPDAPTFVTALVEPAPDAAGEVSAYAQQSHDVLDAQLYTEDEAYRVARVCEREYRDLSVVVLRLADVIAETQECARVAGHGQPTVLDALLGIGEASDVPAEFTAFEVRATRIADRVLRAIMDPAGLYPDTAALRQAMDEGDALRVADAESAIVMELRGAVKDMLLWRREVEGKAIGQAVARLAHYDAETVEQIGKAFLESPQLALTGMEHVQRTMQTARAFAALFAELVRSETDQQATFDRAAAAAKAASSADFADAWATRCEELGYLRAIRDLMEPVARIAAMIGIPLSRDGSAPATPGVEDVTPGSGATTPTLPASLTTTGEPNVTDGQRTE